MFKLQAQSGASVPESDATTSNSEQLQVEVATTPNSLFDEASCNNDAGWRTCADDEWTQNEPSQKKPRHSDSGDGEQPGDSMDGAKPCFSVEEPPSAIGLAKPSGKVMFDVPLDEAAIKRDPKKVSVVHEEDEGKCSY